MKQVIFFNDIDEKGRFMGLKASYEEPGEFGLKQRDSHGLSYLGSRDQRKRMGHVMGLETIVPSVNSFSMVAKKYVKWKYLYDKRTDIPNQFFHVFICEETGEEKTMGQMMGYNFQVQMAKGVEPNWSAPSRETASRREE